MLLKVIEDQISQTEKTLAFIEENFKNREFSLQEITDDEKVQCAVNLQILNNQLVLLKIEKWKFTHEA